MQPTDVGRLLTPRDPRVSPDGTRVAFEVVRPDVEADEYGSRIWLAALDGSELPQPVTSGEGRDRRPRWSPDGGSLAFVSHRATRGATLHVLPLRGGEVRTVVAWPEEIEEVAWSPDGSLLAFLAREPDARQYADQDPKHQPARRVTHLFSRTDGAGWTFDRPRRLFVVPADGSRPPRRVLDGHHEETGFAWAPDGERLAFTAARHPDWDRNRAVDVWVVDVAGGTPQRLTDTVMSCGLPAWSPDGRRIAFAQHDPRIVPSNTNVAVVDVATGTIDVVTVVLDRPCSPVVWETRGPVWDGDALWFQVEDRGNVHLYRGLELVVGGELTVDGFDVVAGALVYCASTPTEPSEVFGPHGRITTLARSFTDDVELVAPVRFTATSPDGAEVEAWIMRPAGAVGGERYPTLLNIHGGPFTQYGNRFLDEFQVQAGAGFAVLYANPRGSSGYGEAWGRAIRGPGADEAPGSGWGGVDFEDVMAVVDMAVASFDFVDPDRLGVVGGSYGGFMTTWVVGHTDRFKAACSERAVNNLQAMEHTADIASWFARWIGRTHLEDPEEFRRQSPVTYVSDVHTPLLILHSEEDYRCPIAQAEELFVALRLLDRPVEFVRFPGECHELSRSGTPRHRVERFEIILDWFTRKL